MQDHYTPTQSTATAVNTSGTGKDAVVPPGVAGWSWGAFLLNWIWAIGNRTWIGLLCLIPLVSVVVAVILGVKGREWAWKNTRWESVEHFNRVQRLWSIWGAIIFFAGMALYVLAIVLSVVTGQH